MEKSFTLLGSNLKTLKSIIFFIYDFSECITLVNNLGGLHAQLRDKPDTVAFYG